MPGAVWGRLGALALSAAALAGRGSAAGVCCGAEEFCSLTLDKVTFAGTHNSGAYGLSIPPVYDIVGVGPKLVSCFYENHDANFLWQLEAGIRFFNIDTCDKDGDLELWNCHAQSGRDDTKAAFSTLLQSEFLAIRDWLLANPTEIVLLSPGDLNTESGSSKWRQAVEAAFGSCTTDTSSDLSAELKCMWFPWSPESPSKLTLRWLIDTGRRLIVFRNNGNNDDGLPNSWGSGNKGNNNNALLSHINQFSHDNMQPGGEPFQGNLWQWDVFGSQKLPEGEGMDLFFALRDTSLKCNSNIAEDTNAFFFPKDDVEEPRYFRSGSDPECDGSCGCLGYRSPLEPVHQWVLDQGHSILAITADYVSNGDMTGTVRRMNMATWRRSQGLLEPGFAWNQCTWGMALIAGVGVVLFIGLALAVAYMGPRLRTKLFCGLNRCCEGSTKTPKKKKKKKKPNPYAPAQTFGAPVGGVAPGGMGVVPRPLAPVAAPHWQHAGHLAQEVMALGGHPPPQQQGHGWPAAAHQPQQQQQQQPFQPPQHQQGHHGWPAAAHLTQNDFGFGGHKPPVKCRLTE